MACVAVAAIRLVAYAMAVALATADLLPLANSFPHRHALEVAAKTLDIPIARTWRQYWPAKKAVELGEPYLWVNFTREEFNAIYDSRVLHMQGEARMRSLVD